MTSCRRAQKLAAVDPAACRCQALLTSIFYSTFFGHFSLNEPIPIARLEIIFRLSLVVTPWESSLDRPSPANARKTSAVETRPPHLQKIDLEPRRTAKRSRVTVISVRLWLARLSVIRDDSRSLAQLCCAQNLITILAPSTGEVAAPGVAFETSSLRLLHASTFKAHAPSWSCGRPMCAPGIERSRLCSSHISSPC